MLVHSLKNSLLIGALFAVVACSSEPTSNSTQQTATEMENNAPAFKPEQVNNKKDPVCGMPVKAGISDTAHYQDKVFGFCSAECKKAFVDSSNIYIGAME
jgi:YHS domain-containing protein